MKKFLFIAAFVFVFAVSWNAGAMAQESDCAAPITLKQGTLTGFEAKGKPVCAWLGVPYAQPPVGDRRWRAPQPLGEGKGTIKAKKFGHWCMQKSIVPFDPTAKSSDMSEDCLFLNIWKPKKEGTFPVMVWIHGGGYLNGSAALPMYSGEALAAEGDVVVVSINYRLGVFGFMAHGALAKEDPNGSTGNYGSMDQVQALKWVRSNISAFGGNPENVTIFGESAGGWSVCTLVATKTANGLFQHAIIESGGCDESVSVEEGEKLARQIAAKVGCGPDDIECMRRVKAKKMLDKTWVSPLSGRFPYINHNDNYFLSKTPRKTIEAGEHNKVPVIVGNNKNEFKVMVTLLPRYYGINKRGKFLKILEEDVGPDYEKLLTLYPVDKYKNLQEAYADMMSDRIMGCPNYLGARDLGRQSKDVYFYRFDYDRTIGKKTAGAFHGLEIPFVLDNFKKMPIKLVFLTVKKDPAKKLSKKMMPYWLRFARTGKPNPEPGAGGDTLSWPNFDPDGDRQRILFGDDISLIREPDNRDAQCEFWQGKPLIPPLPYF